MTNHTVHVFLSYTGREDEVKELQLFTDPYCDALVWWARKRGVDVFYDRTSIDQDRHYSDTELAGILHHGVERSHLFVSFLSPQYIDSQWCRYEFETKLRRAPREIHKIYWKPEIQIPAFELYARVFRAERTRFLIDVLNWDRIRRGDRGHWRSSKFDEWVFDEDPEHPYNFSDVTEVYRNGFWGGMKHAVRCAQKSAEILCREHPDLMGGAFEHNAWS